jgi:hypothetical protein
VLGNPLAAQLRGGPGFSSLAESVVVDRGKAAGENRSALLLPKARANCPSAGLSSFTAEAKIEASDRI